MKFKLALLVLLALSACTEPVPAGHIGLTWEPSGFTGKLLPPGRHDCSGRCRMYLMEAQDSTFTVNMQVLCADRLNFSFDVEVLVSVNTENEQVVIDGFKNLTPAGKVPAGYEGADIAGVISTEQLFNTYVRPVVNQESRKVVSKYETSEIVDKRPQIIEEVVTAVQSAMNTSILRVKRVTVGNLDFPKIVTDAQEQKAQRKVEIETAQAQAKIEEARASAGLKLAEIEYKKQLIEAAMVADANKVIAGSITPQYLAYKQLEVIQNAAAGPNNWGFIPYTDMINHPVDTSKWISPQGIVDSELLARIQEAKASAKSAEPPKAPEKAPEAAPPAPAPEAPPAK